MVTIRCTQKLLRRLPPTEGACASSTVLGDWYANILVTRPQHLVICVSERTLLPVVLPAKPLSTLGPRFTTAVGEVLLQVGVGHSLIAKEQAEMQRFAYGRTQNRRVLGSLNDFIHLLTHYMAARPDATLLEHSVHLARTPCSPIDGFPDQSTRDLFSVRSAVETTQ